MAEKSKDFKKLKEKVNPLAEEMKKYPLVDKKPRDITPIIKKIRDEGQHYAMMGFTERLILKMIGLAFKVERRVPVVRRQALKIMESIKADVVRSYLPFPPYSYAVLISASVFVSLVLTPVFLLTLFLKLYTLSAVVGVVMFTSYLVVGYLYVKPKRRFTGVRNELLQLLGVWYGISMTDMSPQEQFEAMYEILLEYQRLNLKYGDVYPKFKLFEIFHDIHYSMKFKNKSVVEALEETIEKIEDESLKMFFMKVLRAIKEQNDVAPVIESEYFRIVEEVRQDIERSGEMVSMLSEIYTTIISMFAGNLLVFMIVMGALSSFSDAVSSISSGILLTTAIVLITTVGIGVLIRTMFSSKIPARKVPYNPVHTVFSFFAVMLILMLPFLTTVRNPLYLFTPPVFGIIMSLPGFMEVRKVKNVINSSEEDFPHRLHEVSTQLSFGQLLPDAMLSTVLRVKGRIATFNDWIFYTIASYLKFGRTMRDLIEPIIIKIPSDLIRIPMTVIALVEEKASSMDKVFENVAIYVENVLESATKVKGYVSQIKMMSIAINVMSLVIISYLLIKLIPGQLAVPMGTMSGGNTKMFNISFIGKQYLAQYQRTSPFLFTVQSRLFPQTMTSSPTSVQIAVGMVGIIVFLFSIVFALSTATFIVILDDNPTAPEFAFYFSLFLLIFLVAGYKTAFSNIYGYEEFTKSLKIVNVMKNVTVINTK